MIDGLSEWFIFAVLTIIMGALFGRFSGYLSGMEYGILAGMTVILALVKITIDTQEAMVISMVLAGALLIALGRKVMMSVALAGNAVFFVIIVPENFDKVNWFK